VAKKASAFTPPPEDELEMVGGPLSKVSGPVGEPVPTPTPAVPPPPPSKALPSYRVGKRNLSAWIDEKAFNQFKAMVSEEGKTIQDYMVEMVNREFARKGRPQIAK
jgi:hypothetical protein